jgi:hypothetical protein
MGPMGALRITVFHLTVLQGIIIGAGHCCPEVYATLYEQLAPYAAGLIPITPEDIRAVQSFLLMHKSGAITLPPKTVARLEDVIAKYLAGELPLHPRTRDLLERAIGSYEAGKMFLPPELADRLIEMAKKSASREIPTDRYSDFCKQRVIFLEAVLEGAYYFEPVRIPAACILHFFPDAELVPVN